jgi:hypothetical protein
MRVKYRFPWSSSPKLVMVLMPVNASGICQFPVPSRTPRQMRPLPKSAKT